MEEWGGEEIITHVAFFAEPRARWWHRLLPRRFRPRRQAELVASWKMGADD